MVCHSYTGTMKLLNKLSDDYDAKVMYWSESLIPVLMVSKLHDWSKVMWPVIKIFIKL